MKRRRFAWPFRWICSVPILLACAAPVAPANAARVAGEVELDSGSAVVDGVSMAYEIGTLYVPENRQTPQSRIIGVGFVRIKSSHQLDAPPIFALPGGPGNTVLDALDRHDDWSLRQRRAWSGFRDIADLVLIEQRGYTMRGERLEIATPALPMNRPGTVQTDIETTRALARSAVAANPGTDLRGYSVIECAADVDDLRKALGYAKITLVGTSFGSQWSFAVMRLYPQSVVRALLSGVEPLDYGYDMPSHVYAALQRIAFDADRDAGLVPYLPKGGIMAAVRAVRERLDRAPVTVVSRDEKSGTKRIVVLGPGDFELGLVSYAENADRWPAFVLSVYHRHYDAWARDVIEQRKAGMLTLIGPLIDTSLGVTPAREHQLRTDPAVAMLGTWSFAAYLASAADWPTPDVGDAFREPVTTSIPVLFVQGDWDTSTPVENTLNILPGFPNGRAILVHRGQHKGALTLLKHDPMLTAALHTFLKTGDMRDLPTRISVDSPQFARPDFPSVPLSR